MRFLSFAAVLCLAPAAPAAKPNVLLVLADDQRFDTIAALGNTMGNWSEVRLDLATAGVTLSATTQIGFFQGPNPS